MKTLTRRLSKPLVLNPAFPELEKPGIVLLLPGGDGFGLMFGVMRVGQVLLADLNDAPGVSNVFLDITDRVTTDGQEGLLSVASDPAYSKQWLPLRTLFHARTAAIGPVPIFCWCPGPPRWPIHPVSWFILEVPQPANHHNAEHLAFGPDGLLYVALGDGGVSEGLTDNPHDLTNVSGTIIRLDISQSIENEPYAIPADNPFIGSGDEVRKEIWAYGFRNPWRFDFDESTGRIWVADVGSRKREEVDLVLPGRNYGWPTMEGS